MKPDYEILSLFKGNPQKEFSTTEIIESIYSTEAKEYNEIIESNTYSYDSKKIARESLAMLHRRILYHLSSLVKKELLVVTKVEDKGKKFYSLAIADGEELVIDSHKRKIIITQSSAPNIPLGDIEDKKLAFKVERDSFCNKVNAILIDSTKFANLNELYELIYSLFSEVNDVVGINDFEFIIQNQDNDSIMAFFDKMGEECESYDRRISCVIDFTNIINNFKVKEFFRKNISKINERIIFVFDITSREMIGRNEIIETLIEVYSANKRKLNIKNDDLHKTPYIIGKAGPYAFSQTEWAKYLQVNYKDSLGLVCTQASIISDVAEFYKHSPSAKEYKEHILKLAKALFISNVHQRKSTFKSFKKLGKNLAGWQTFEYSKNCIRLWNYEHNSSPEDQNLFIDTLEEIKKEVEIFSKIQETIYLSCGMPTGFKIGFAIAYRNFDKANPLDENFRAINISNYKDLYSTEIKERLIFLEKAAKLFEAGMEVKFNHSGNERTLDVFREINIILNSHNIPFFCYSFKNPTGINMSLNTFLK